MNRFLMILAISLMAFPLCAQNIVEEELPLDPTEAQIDSLLADKSVREAMPDGVTLYQSEKINAALLNQIQSNSGRKFNGYRVRIFLDSSKSARDASLRVLNSFQAMYPDVPSFRVYESPNFRVLVGNFRTRLEAENFARAIKVSFPGASVVRDKFKYPSIGSPNTVSRDTVVFKNVFIGL